MDFELTEFENDFVELCQKFADGPVASEAPKAWHEGRCATSVLRQMGEAGLLGALVPEEWGGIGMSTVGFVAGLEVIGRVDQSIVAAWQAHSTIGSIPLLLFGTDDQRERWLRPLAEGRHLGAFGLTEPQAGSDARGIQTTASKVDGGWRINGQKTFISNAGTDMSYGVVVLARIDGEDGAFGNFVVETGTDGYSTGPKMQGIGWRGLDTRELFFDDAFVGDDHLIGDRTTGLSQFLATLETGRISVAALSVSLAQGVLDLALAYAKDREQFGSPISKFQAVRFKLADMAAGVDAARLLTYRAAWLRDQGRPFRKEAAIAKLLASRTAMACASEAVQVFGGIGYMLDTPVARFFCDAKVLEIGEGTNEIQRLVISSEMGC